MKILAQISWLYYLNYFRLEKRNNKARRNKLKQNKNSKKKIYKEQKGRERD